MRLKRILPALVALPVIALSAYLLRAQVAKATGPATAEVRVGTGVEKLELQGEAASFKVAPGTRIFAWTKVTGAADTTVTFVFKKGETTSKQTLQVPRSPYRTHAYRTFRKGDDGEWTVTLLGAQEAVLGKASFTVRVE